MLAPPCYAVNGHAPVAQLDRASASGAEGCRFEPYRAYQPVNNLAGLALPTISRGQTGDKLFGLSLMSLAATSWLVTEDESQDRHSEFGKFVSRLIDLLQLRLGIIEADVAHGQ